MTAIGFKFAVYYILLILCTYNVSSFVINSNREINQQPQTSLTFHSSSLDNENNEIDKEYRNLATQLLSNFLPKEKDNNVDTETKQDDPLPTIDFNAPKAKKKSLQELSTILDYELYEKEWFVTGNVNPIYFSDNFQFQDPDVKINGIEEYARGVYKLFDTSSRAEIISTVVNTTVPDTITVTWRLSGKVNIGPGLNIKPYIVYTDFLVDSDSGLIISQEDRFDLPGWDILLSSFFPFLIGKLTAPPAPEVEPRIVSMPTSTASNGAKDNFLSKILNNILQQIN